MCVEKQTLAADQDDLCQLAMGLVLQNAYQAYRDFKVVFKRTNHFSEDRGVDRA